MRSLSHLFDNNRAWSERIRRASPDFFADLSRQQRPRYLWIGCADSRVPANEIVGLRPGELFVHRNIANVVVHTDLNCLSVMQFAVDVLKVEHVIVCGHYGCSGVAAALENRRVGLADNWLRHVQDVHSKHNAHVAGVSDLPQRIDRLCELNVIEQSPMSARPRSCRTYDRARSRCPRLGIRPEGRAGARLADDHLHSAESSTAFATALAAL
jgi:carbonic anhydrase